MRFYTPTVLTSSLLLLLASHFYITQPQPATPEANELYPAVQLADNNGQPSHRGSGRKEFFEVVQLTDEVA